jgi:hypothetical protein
MFAILLTYEERAPPILLLVLVVSDMKLFSSAICCNTVLKSVATLFEPVALGAEHAPFPRVEWQAPSQVFVTMASMSIQSKSM